MGFQHNCFPISLLTLPNSHYLSNNCRPCLYTPVYATTSLLRIHIIYIKFISIAMLWHLNIQIGGFINHIRLSLASRNPDVLYRYCDICFVFR